MTLSNQASDETIAGDVVFPEYWTVFAPIMRADPVLSPEQLRDIPAEIKTAQATLTPVEIVPTRGQYDFREFLGRRPHGFEKGAYVFMALESGSETAVTMGLGWDCWLDAWLNGEPLLEKSEASDRTYPPGIKNNLLTLKLRAGRNILALRYISGTGPSILALAGPRELRRGDFRPIVDDPLICDAAWSRADLRALPGGKPVARIDDRRELFVDDFIIDAAAGALQRRLHHPAPREAVMFFGERGMPWEGNGGYPAFVRDGSRILLYYSGRPANVADESQEQVTCLALSDDGINFVRPELGLYEYQGSKKNNIIWRGTPSHNFTPFIDDNPAAPEDQRFKALAYHVNGKGLGAYASPDGVHWRILTDERIITQGGFDSQNLAFWDPLRGVYAAYCRRCRNQLPGRTFSGTRDIITCTSEDFIHWTEPRYIEYTDSRVYELYTNAIRPYYRAPHIYLGTPARFFPARRKVAAHPHSGVSDALLMSSRDGLLFDRWSEAFIRPGPEPEVWTDRNNYPAWGMLELQPGEISIYWGEHNRHPAKRLRRGVIRADGFVSAHVGGADIGELLTRPLIFSGAALEVNYATSAGGAIVFEVCDADGRPLEGLALEDCETLYGNELGHLVAWRGRTHVLGDLAGQPVRLRARLQDADLFAFRFRG